MCDNSEATRSGAITLMLVGMRLAFNIKKVLEYIVRSYDKRRVMHSMKSLGTSVPTYVIVR